MTDVNFKTLHCLIVDDDPTFLMMTEAMLKGLGIGTTSTARNGSEAITMLAKSTRAVDAILCDFMMPAGNGLQLLKYIRTGQLKSCRPDACFIVVSMHTGTDVIKTAASLDANGYLAKPLTREKLRATIVKARTKYFAVDPVRYAQIAVPLSAL